MTTEIKIFVKHGEVARVWTNTPTAKTEVEIIASNSARGEQIAIELESNFQKVGEWAEVYP